MIDIVFIAKNKKSARDLGFEIMEATQSNWAGKRVLIKPNLTIKAVFDSGIITNPVFCEGVIDYLKKNSAKKIAIGEGTSGAVDNEMKEVYKATGFLDLSLKTGVELININKDEIIEGVNLPKSILDFDVLLNVPVLKTHHIALVTLGIKNLMGLFLPVKDRNQAFHKKLNNLRENVKKEGRHSLNDEEFKQAHTEISEKIIDLYKTVNSKIKIVTVIDGFYGRDGNGFETGETKNMGIAIAGENTVAVDTIGAYIMGFYPVKSREAGSPTATFNRVNPKTIYYLALAQKQKLEPNQLSKIKIKGVNPKEIRESFKVITVMDERI